MNILILTREYTHPLLPASGGTGHFNASLAKELVKRGHRVWVFGVWNTNVDFEDEGVQVHYIKNLFKRNAFFNFLRSITHKIPFLMRYHFQLHKREKKNISKKLYSFIKKHNLSIDIIENHDFEGLSLFLNNSIPYVIRCHGSFSVLEKYFHYKEIGVEKKHCEREAFKKAKNIIAVSKFSERINRELFGTTDFKLIYNGINTQEFQRDKTVNTIPYSLFFIGNCTVEKGVDTAFKVFQILEKQFPEATLHYIGRATPYQEELQRDIETATLTGKVVFHGYQPKERVIRLLSSANVVICPSKGENFSLALLEAMALSKPVVTSNIDSFKEIIVSGRNGFICENENDYVTHIGNLFKNPVPANEIAENARKTVVENFSIEKMIAETENYYTAVIQKHFPFNIQL